MTSALSCENKMAYCQECPLQLKAVDQDVDRTCRPTKSYWDLEVEYGRWLMYEARELAERNDTEAEEIYIRTWQSVQREEKEGEKKERGWKAFRYPAAICNAWERAKFIGCDHADECFNEAKVKHERAWLKKILFNKFIDSKRRLTNSGPDTPPPGKQGEDIPGPHHPGDDVHLAQIYFDIQREKFQEIWAQVLPEDIPPKWAQEPPDSRKQIIAEFVVYEGWPSTLNLFCDYLFGLLEIPENRAVGNLRRLTNRDISIFKLMYNASTPASQYSVQEIADKMQVSNGTVSNANGRVLPRFAVLLQSEPSKDNICDALHEQLKDGLRPADWTRREELLLLCSGYVEGDLMKNLRSFLNSCSDPIPATKEQLLEKVRSISVKA